MSEQMFGRYRLLSLLGRGGMGEVWRAIDTRKDREVALKVLGSWLNGDPDFAARFRREATLAARLNSPHIVPIHDYGEIDGQHYIEMALVEGTDFDALLKNGPMPAARAVEIVAQAARALAVAHRAGLVHRDIKPSNILVYTEDEGDHVYLIDFGIARALDGTRLTSTGRGVGTPAYMAPERFVGDGDERSDIYSLGCVLYQALSGEPPFTAPHDVAYAHLHRHVEPPLPSTRNAAAPAALDAVVARTLAKAPEDRYPAAGDLAAAARRAVTDAPPTATATSASPRGAAPIPTKVDLGGLGPQAKQGRKIPIPPPETRNPQRGRRVVRAIARMLGQPDLVIGDARGVSALAVTELDDSALAVVGCVDGSTWLVNLEEGTTLGLPLFADRDHVTAIAITMLNGRPMAVSGEYGGAIRLWDLTTFVAVGPPLNAGIGSAR